MVAAGIGTKDEAGVRVQAWVPPSLARELKAAADADRRSVSATIRIAVEDRLRDKGSDR